MPSTLIQVLENASVHTDLGLHYINADHTITFQSYANLKQEATQILAGLSFFGRRPGQGVILALSSNQEIITAFWACLLGGMIPTILPTPTSLYGANKSLEKLQNVWDLFDEPLVLLPESLLEHQMDKILVTPIPYEKLQTVSSLKREGKKPLFHVPQPQDPAFIQFSSGTTGNPKGVILTHENICSHLESLKTFLKSSLEEQQDGSSLSWLPLYHDMGLVGFHLEPIYIQRQQYHISPLDFIRNPALWLDHLEKHHIHSTAAPNFSQKILLDFLAKHPERRWDLSSVKTVYNGAEPISVQLMFDFSKKMQAHQLAPEAMLPVYGLAEATLAVTLSPLGELPQVVWLDRTELQQHQQAIMVSQGNLQAMRFVKVGFPLPGMELRIVDAQDAVVVDGMVGHLQVRGTSITPGYYHHKKLTEAAFCGDWLRTGDLGFLHLGQLCVTGRAKDVIFVNGQNYYSEDLEEMAKEVLGDPLVKLAVCGSFEESLQRDRVLLFIVGEDPTDLVRQFIEVKRFLSQKLRFQIDTLVPLQARHFPRTSSGKLQRYQLRSLFEKGELTGVIERIAVLVKKEESETQEGKVLPQSSTQKLVHQVFCEEFGIESQLVGVHDSFSDLGVSSVKAFQVFQRLELRYGIRLEPSILNQCHNIVELSEYIDAHPVMVHRRDASFKG